MQSWFIILLLPSDNRSFLYISNRIFHQSQPAVCQARCCGSAGPPHREPESAKQRHGRGSAALQASHQVPRQRKQYSDYIPCSLREYLFIYSKSLNWSKWLESIKHVQRRFPLNDEGQVTSQPSSSYFTKSKWDLAGSSPFS